MNSTRCATSLAIARRIASRTSGTRSAIDNGSPRRNRRRDRAGRGIRRQDLALNVERDDRLRQPCQHRFEEWHLLQRRAPVDDRLDQGGGG